MTIATKPTTVRIDENLKAQANEILGSVGLSYNAYVVMATRQLVNQRRIPFEIVPAVGIPNEETRRALVAAEAKELGLISDDAPAFADVDGLMAFLEEE
ncbi:type II toxin-antitoxin system RelB/DinJ family antitoxin [Paraeggerthella hongkongensis]|uniref:type II toxin-antitoxin system RelB/DinJ family antitoxin n=1 Tax=Paraeggerthella TaxID=651554 RepID=UPI001C1090D9|nr:MULTISPECIES: type II toxin-antitoxin system RelB/DinJ family antitoxin [Paraeggerthella]MBU5404362.1 type II toxin-antitoxin system RelB/DinJ family antitoxin [Paraeggerthella hongkongensis]MCD2432058.1 type II toxin-antitoxin system RelB/DinJ family antitoxin [Paraeggerthella hominis]